MTVTGQSTSPQALEGYQLRFAQLDSLRGVAAFAVFLGHIVYALDWSGAPIFWMLDSSPIALAWDGGAAVVVFFILSGYVLFQPWLLGKEPAYAAFMVRRVTRIYLPFAVVASLCCLSLTYLGAPRSKDGGAEVSGILALWHNCLLTGKYNILNPPGWSLIEEMRISVVFPLLAVAVRAVPWWISICLSVLASVALSRLNSMELPYLLTTFGGTARWVMLFVLGAVLAKHRTAIDAWYSRLSGLEKSSLAGVAIVLYSAKFATFLPFHTDKYFPWLGLAIMFIGVTHSARVARAFKFSLFSFLGRISFSLYLVHYPIMLAAAAWSSWPVTVTVLASLTLATVFHACVEAPFHRLGVKLTHSQKPSVI